MPQPSAHHDVLHAAVAAAIQAPSTHNTQPWRFKINGPSLELYADDTRRLRVIDSDRRQQLQSCGCALLNARVAVRALGYEERITVWVADLAAPTHLATLTLGAQREPTASDRAWYEAIPRRRTNRHEFLTQPVPWSTTEELRAVASAEGAAAVRLGPLAKEALGDLVAQADRLQFEDAAFRNELAGWLTAFGSRRRDGIPFVEKEYGSALPFTVLRSLRSPTIGEEFAAIEQEHILGAPAVLALGTPTDDPTDWLACGQALQAVLLTATCHGLAASFLNQVLEIPELRADLAALAPEIGLPQMLLRLGEPAAPVRHPAPRRAISEVLEG